MVTPNKGTEGDIIARRYQHGVLKEFFVMQFLNGKIHDGERTLLEGLSIYIKEVTKPSGIKSWSGGFDLPEDKYIEVGGPYRISLEDGRTGDILVTEVNYSSRSPIRVFFKGVSPLD